MEEKGLINIKENKISLSEKKGGLKENLPLYFISGLLVLAFSFLASFKSWPLLDGDAPYFMVPALEFSEGRGLINPVWIPPLDESVDGVGGRRYIYHGFLYPLLIGRLGAILGGGGAACLTSIHWFNLVAALVSAAGVLAFAWGSEIGRKVFSFALPLVFFVLCEAMMGRPEPIAIFLLGCALLAGKNISFPKLSGLWCFLGVLLFFSSPGLGVLGGVLLLLARLRDKQPPRLSDAVWAIGGILGGLLLCSSVYPYPLVDWFQGVKTYGQNVLFQPAWQGFVPTWITRPQTPFLLVTLAVPAVMAAATLRHRPEGVSLLRWIASLVVAVVFGGLLFKLAFVKTEASYNAVVWLPVFLAGILVCSQSVMKNPLILICLALPLLGWLRSWICLLHQTRENTVGFAEVQEIIRGKEKEGIQVSRGLFLAVSNPEKVFFEQSHGNPPGIPGWRIEQQTNRGLREPPEFPGYRLVENRFGPPIKILGLPISRTPGGWEYALYRRSD